MREYAIKPLDASTWDAFARFAEKHNGIGFGGCWCTWFHSREGRPDGDKGRSVSFATFALRAGISTFELSRYMGASL